MEWGFDMLIGECSLGWRDQKHCDRNVRHIEGAYELVVAAEIDETTLEIF